MLSAYDHQNIYGYSQAAPTTGAIQPSITANGSDNKIRLNFTNSSGLQYRVTFRIEFFLRYDETLGRVFVTK